jgi:Amt family ammonium transporter
MSNSDTNFSSQFIGVLAVTIFVFIVSLIVWKILAATTGIRISKDAEKLGTDKAEIGVIAYGIRD